MTVILAAVVMAGLVLQAPANEIPLLLPKPEGQPGNPKKKVKVYLLAGQSKMVGMGELNRAQPLYPSVYLSADPAVIPGVMPIGGSGLAVTTKF